MRSEKSSTFTEFIVAGTALFVSLTTLIVYIYQAKIMKEQQHIAVWPYVEWLTSNTDGYYITARNKGVGPAIIKKVEMTLDGKPIKNNRELLGGVLGNDYQIHLWNSTLEGRVMLPGEEVIPFRIMDQKEGRDFEERFQKHAFEMRVTYCSVYGDCWVSSGTKVEPINKKGNSLF